MLLNRELGSIAPISTSIYGAAFFFRNNKYYAYISEPTDTSLRGNEPNERSSSWGLVLPYICPGKPTATQNTFLLNLAMPPSKLPKTSASGTTASMRGSPRPGSKKYGASRGSPVNGTFGKMGAQEESKFFSLVRYFYRLFLSPPHFGQVRRGEAVRDAEITSPNGQADRMGG